jgi:hypothetical protein
LELRRVHPGWGPRRILYDLQRDPALAGVVVPSRSGIYRALVRAKMIDPQARRRRDEHWRRWERGEPRELWQMDVVGGFALADGRRAKALTGIDDPTHRPPDPCDPEVRLRMVAALRIGPRCHPSSAQTSCAILPLNE